MTKIRREKKLKSFVKSNSFLALLILVVTLFLGTGYAQLTGVDLTINGAATLSPEKSVFISDITYLSGSGVTPSDSTINDPYLTFMGSTIVLGNDSSSTISYKIKVKNNLTVPAIYSGPIYSAQLGYDNADIEFVVSGITSGYVLNPNDECEFTVTFKYINGLSSVTNNTLHSYINFKFDEQNKIAKIGNTYYDTLQAALNDVSTTGEETVVELLQNTGENVTIASGKNVVLDLNHNTLSNDGNDNVIKNNGTLKITGGTIQSDASSNGAVNNNSTGTIVIDGASIIMTGGRQALYNDKGIATITGNSYLSATTSARAAVQNQASGRMTITGGTIVSTGFYALNNAGTLTVGEKDGTVSSTSPVFQGANYGINSTTNYSFYDGIVKSKTNPFNNISKITDMETGYGIINSTEVIDGQTYNTAHLGISKKVTFNAMGGIITDNIRYIEVGHPVGTLPTTIRSGYDFAGWFTADDREIAATEIITDDINFYAHWVKTTNVAQIGTTIYGTVQDAINAVPTNNTQTTILLLKDSSEELTVASGKNIVLDLNGNTLTNFGNKPVFENNGSLHISNGTIRSTAEQSIINQVAGSLTISSGQYIITGTKQALYITGGTVEITGTAYLSSRTSGIMTGATMSRGTVHNVSGTLIITGGTIVGNVQQAVSNESTMIIGTKDGTVNSTTPVIKGETYGIVSSTGFSFYDGIVKGITDAISGTVADQETTLATGTEVIDGKTYKTQFNS